VQERVSQRIYGLALGYEDLNDHDHLRRDPVHGLICGKSDPLGQDRILERDKGKALAGHSTLNRLELSAEAIDARYQKIQAQPDKIEELFIKRNVKAIPRRSAEIVLDFDATDDPLHGSQEALPQRWHEPTIFEDSLHLAPRYKSPMGQQVGRRPINTLWVGDLVQAQALPALTAHKCKLWVLAHEGMHGPCHGLDLRRPRSFYWRTHF
jgi:hypothetical protein